MKVTMKWFKHLTGKNKKIILSALVIIALVVVIFIFARTANNKEENTDSGTSAAGTNSNYQIKYFPLTPEEIAKVSSAILSSEFIKSIPENEPISLIFFKFENGERIWQDGFLIGRNQLLSEGSPGISLTLHSKYISQFDGSNLCDIIQQANKNRDLGSESKYSTTGLLLRYSGMLKYRECFGF